MESVIEMLKGGNFNENAAAKIMTEDEIRNLKIQREEAEKLV